MSDKAGSQTQAMGASLVLRAFTSWALSLLYYSLLLPIGIEKCLMIPNSTSFYLYSSVSKNCCIH